MATRSNIIAKLSDGTFKRVYCHWDGYPSHNGRILQDAYGTQTKVDKLMRLGDMSSLGESCSRPAGHTFDKPAVGHCVSYGRDRKEKDAKGVTGADLASVWPSYDAMQEFVYVWNGKQWQCFLPGYAFLGLVSIGEAIAKSE